MSEKIVITMDCPDIANNILEKDLMGSPLSEHEIKHLHKTMVFYLQFAKNFGGKMERRGIVQQLVRIEELARSRGIKLEIDWMGR